MKSQHIRSGLFIGVLAAAVLLLPSGVNRAAESPKDESAAKPSVKLIKTPPPEHKSGDQGKTEEIKGKVSGLSSFKDYRIVIYAKGGDIWYIQPKIKEPYTLIGDDGEFSADIFGGDEYAALLVKESYKPKERIEGNLPAKGGDVLSIDRRRPGYDKSDK